VLEHELATKSGGTSPYHCRVKNYKIDHISSKISLSVKCAYNPTDNNKTLNNSTIGFFQKKKTQQ
jgi:hypothetical protein